MTSSTTLLLDAGYTPLQLIPWQRALTLLVLDKVELLEAYDEVVRGVSRTFEMPSVVRLRRFVRRTPPVVSFSRSNVYRRDGYTCQYCGDTPGSQRLTIDHVVPRAQGGRLEWTNAVAACFPCNARKGNRTPDQAGMALRKRPDRPARLPDLYGGPHVHQTWRAYVG